MKLAYIRVETLPRLSWCARMEAGSDLVRVMHGPWVETSEGFFSEGAWNGDFASGDFEGRFFTGTGGKSTPEGFLAATPNHTLDRLFLLRRGDTLFVSNSLYFTLAQARDELDPGYLFYDSRLASIVEGIRGYARCLPTRDGCGVRVLCHANAIIGPDLKVRERPRLEEESAVRADRRHLDGLRFARRRRALASGRVHGGLRVPGSARNARHER